MSAWFDFAWKFFVAVGALAFTAGTLYFQWKRGKNSAGLAAAAEWEKVAGARKAEIDSLKEDLSEMSGAKQKLEADLRKVQSDHNECTQQVLRLLARMQKHERVINTLERRCNLPETDFGDPQHRSETPDRSET